ncbi:hypothetical protein [Dactylosporangium sp. CA-092794]|uniref:hypothetical protein n=1 Tax=Dactylosporangium sp. CA-092794 TaxID=3239929 RepID=UPI003D933D25
MTALHLNLSLMTPGHFRHAWRLPHADPLAYLQRRGLLQTEYAHPTLRGRLGLPWPKSLEVPA